MAEGYFTEAASLMKEGGLDPREVIAALLSDHLPFNTLSNLYFFKLGF